MIRPLERDDARATATLLRSVRPDYISATRVLHLIDGTPPRARGRAWVAEVDGDIVGFGRAELEWWVGARRDVGRAAVAVAQSHRGRGIGGRLYDVAEVHLREVGARVAAGSTGTDAYDRGFAERRGFRQTRLERYWTLDPRDVDLSPLLRLEEAKRTEGYRVLPLADLRDREHDLYELYMATAKDVPADDELGGLDFEEWCKDIWADPDLSFEASFVVLADERPVAATWVVVDPEGARADNDFTGTLREYRRRGLARLAKLASLRWAAENGIRTFSTSNDSTNADMLALNEHLGYRPTVERAEMRKELPA